MARLRRCNQQHPMHRQVRCEELEGHLDAQRDHGNSFYARYWEEPEEWEKRQESHDSIMADFSAAMKEF